ncbi:MAG TPA: hypothetical protein VFM90_01485 [Cyclobacteriaceae bacterium]|nr:hypothetical protein [Cyclobacteriaceae bacterium]
MKKRVLTGLIFLLPLLAIARNGADKDFSVETNLRAFLATGHYNARSVEVFESFLHKLDKKNTSAKRKRVFVRHIFEKTHQRFLKNYTAHTSLSETFDTGSYNCLTGTILFSLLLQHYGIEHQVIETNYHIFILAQTAEGKILLEATDPLNGFVTSAKEIDVRIAHYRQNQVQRPLQDKSYYKFRFELYNTVTLNELRGLLYYNNAVNAFNQKHLEIAVQNLVKASNLYFSYRMEEFSQILLLSLQQSNLDLHTKENWMNAILRFRQNSLPVLSASN